MQSQELVHKTAPIGELARRSYAREQIELIKQTVAHGATDAELDLFLELAARYELDPFAGHIWCARMAGKNGERGRMAVLIGRDGMLVLARRDSGFKGVRGNVVHENDDFEVDDDTEKGVLVRHRMGKPSERGPIVGAWALVNRDGEEPYYFYANLDEYRGSEKTPWGKQTSAMILKCAQSTALRFAYSITGLIGAEEVSSQLADPTKALADADAATGEIEWGDNEELAHRLADLFAAANATVEHSYRPRKIQAMLAGKTEGERRQVALDLEKFIEQNGGTVPEPQPLDITTDEPETEEADWQPVNAGVPVLPEEEAGERVVEEGKDEPEPPDQEKLPGT
jgi:phage recombination protein Bet